MTKKKDAIDSIFDGLDRIVDGAAAVLKDVPERDGDEEDSPDSGDDYAPGNKRVIDVPISSQPLLKSEQQELPMGNRKQPRNVPLKIRNVSKAERGGVTIIAETPTHEVVAIRLSQEDWKKVYDAADWFRMVQD